MLETRRLTMFCAVVDEGSFRAAADRLYLTQSAVSQQMAILEREVGIPLLERLPRGVRPTAAGQVLADRARGVLQQLIGVEREIHRLAAGPRQVRLGTFSTAGADLIPLVVQHYRHHLPKSRLVVVPCRPAEVNTQLADRTIDLSLLWEYAYLAGSHEGLWYERLFDDPLRLLVPRDHPLVAGLDGCAVPEVDLATLADQPWVVRRHLPPHDDAFATMCHRAGFDPDVAFTAEDYPSVQGLVAAGVGIGVVPELSLTARHADVMVLPFADPALSRRIGTLAQPDARREPAVVQLLEVLVEVAQVLVHPKDV